MMLVLLLAESTEKIFLQDSPGILSLWMNHNFEIVKKNSINEVWKKFCKSKDFEKLPFKYTVFTVKKTVSPA